MCEEATVSVSPANPGGSSAAALMIAVVDYTAVERFCTGSCWASARTPVIFSADGNLLRSTLFGSHQVRLESVTRTAGLSKPAT
jgi:hypothetical protein